MKLRWYNVVLMLSLLGINACSTFSAGKEQHSAPQGVQSVLQIDWRYTKYAQQIKPFGAKPLELGSVASVNGTTYVSSTLGHVIAIDEASAQTAWDADLKIPVTSGPVIYENSVFIALENGAVIRLSRADGKEIWRYDTGSAVENALSVKDGIVSCVNANNRIFALDAETGKIKWRRERPRPNEFTMYGQTAPLIDNGTIYAGFSDGYLVAYSAANGTAIFSRELAPNARFKDLDLKPLKIDGIIYVASSSGGLYALSSEDGRTLWQRDIIGISSIRAFQDCLYISSQSGIFRLKRDTGDTVWQNVIQKESLISPIVLGRKYIFASVQRFGLVVLDRVNGELLHVADMGSDFTSAPTLSHGALTVLSNNSTVYRLLVDDEPL